MKNILEVRGLDKSFKGLKILDQLDFSLAEGEILSILGPSGCGKSTILRLVSGLDLDYGGELIFQGRQIEGPGLDRGIVFQEPRLFPWLSVEKNIEFGLGGRMDLGEKRKLLEDYLDLLELKAFRESLPRDLSGGMQQRVSLGRSLVNKPRLLLLDEPFGALDAMTRFKMQRELLDIWAREDLSMILVTHDIEEAIYLSDRILILSPLPAREEEILAVDIPRSDRLSSLDLLEMKEYIYRKYFKDRA